MLATSMCPSNLALHGYLNGQLNDDDSSAVEQHLSLCRSCESVVEQLESRAKANPPPDLLLELLPQAGRYSAIHAAPGHGCAAAGHGDSMPPQSLIHDEDLRDNGGEVSELACGTSQSQDSSHSDNSTPGVQASRGDSRPDAMMDMHGSPFQESWEDLAGRKLSCYELVERIGSGGMGMVYRARHRSLGKLVAVKLLPHRREADAAAVARFQREMRLVGRLNHPAIVTATDAGLDGGTHFLVMELIDGLDLSRIAQSLGRIPSADVAEIGRQVAVGLEYAHIQGVIHRDIKPSNLMLDGSGQVKLLDLGLADLCAWCQPIDEWTTVGHMLGTLDYMAPEQADGPKAVSHRSDLYSLGATLFRLLTGRPPLAPIPDASPLEKLRRLATEHPPPIQSQCPDVPAALARVIDQLLQRDPTRRTLSAADVAEQLAPVTSGADLHSLLDKARRDLSEEPAYRPSMGPVVGPLPAIDIRAEAKWLQLNDPLPEDAGRNHAQPETPLRPYRRFGRGWQFVAGLLAGAGGTILLGTILIVLETMQGQVVIETDQADIQVRVVADGQPVRHLELHPGANSIRLRANQYEITIDQPADRTVMIENGQFELRRGETVVARIRSRPREAPPAGLASLLDLDQPSDRTTVQMEIMYEGRTASEWVDVLRTERSPPAVRAALEALSELRPEGPNGQVLELVLATIQRHGASALGIKKGSKSVRLLASLAPPEQLILQLIHEMAENPESAASFDDTLLELLAWEVSDAGKLTGLVASLLEVLPKLPSESRAAIAKLSLALAEQLATSQEVLAERLLDAVLDKHADHEGLVFQRTLPSPLTAQRQPDIPRVLSDIILADNLRWALGSGEDHNVLWWHTFLELRDLDASQIAQLRRRIPDFLRRMLDKSSEVIISREALGPDISRGPYIMWHAMLSPRPGGQVGNLHDFFESGLSELVAESGLKSEFDSDADLKRLPAPSTLPIFHYSLIFASRWAVPEDRVAEWLREKQHDLQDSHERFLELMRLISQWEVIWAENRGRAPPPALSGHGRYANYLYRRSEIDLRNFASVPPEMKDAIVQAGVRPPDFEIWKEIDEAVVGYWDYILVTGALHRLTRGPEED